MVFRKLARLATHLDQIGQAELADQIDSVLRLAQTSGPNNLNLPMDSRVVPFDDDEYEEEDVLRNQHPRYRAKPYFQDTQGPDTDEEHSESIFGLNSPKSEQTGVTQKVFDFSSPGMDSGNGGLDDYEWDNSRRDNPFHMIPRR